MQSCWELRPEDRPNFSEVYQNLNAINLSFGLVATVENQGQDASQNQAGSPDQAQNPIQVNLDVVSVNMIIRQTVVNKTMSFSNQCIPIINTTFIFQNDDHNRNYSQHSVQNEADIEINSHENSREINIVELANAQNVPRSQASTSEHVQPVENPVPEYPGEVSNF